MKPILQPDVSYAVIAMIALLNPVVIAVGLWLGARCDQPQKLPIAGFAAAVAGIALVWVAAYLRLPYVGDAARAAGGLLVAQMVAGTIWASMAFVYVRSRSGR